MRNYYFQSIDEKNVEKKFARKECGHFNEVGEKIIFMFFGFGCATQNKALGMMKLVSIFFFHQRIYGVNFKRIDNGPHAPMISTIAAGEIF